MEICFAGRNQVEYRECDLLCLFGRLYWFIVAVWAPAAQGVYAGMFEKQDAMPGLSVESDQQGASILW